MDLTLPDSEFQARWRRVQERIRAKGLDVLVAHSNEADFANVRYLSEYWPIFLGARPFSISAKIDANVSTRTPGYSGSALSR